MKNSRLEASVMTRSRFNLLITFSILLLNACGGGGSTSVTSLPPTPPPPSPLAIYVVSQPPQGYRGNPFNSSDSGYVMSATGGIPPYQWSWAAATGSALPPGLNISITSDGGGAIKGIPTTNGIYNVVVALSDFERPLAKISQAFTITVADPAPLVLAPGSPPMGLVAAGYDVNAACGAPIGDAHLYCVAGFPFPVSGGVPPYQWSWTAAPRSSLPSGLGLTSGSVGVTSTFPPTVIFGELISGTPTTPGTFNVTVTVSDFQSPAKTASQDYSIVIKLPSPPVVNTPNIVFFAVNQPYSYTFVATGGLPPFIWSETGPLAPGLMLNSQGSLAGALTGTPTVAGTFPIKVTATDAFSQASAPVDFIVQIYPHGFNATGSMAVPRSSGHTATRLPNGKVLVAGLPDNGVINAEVYDPVAGTFSSTGDMVNGRSTHAATLLNNGMVLLTGGWHFQELATAELYDPNTETFSSTAGLMTTARAEHSSTLLNNGWVLLVGGLDGAGNPLHTAELYDPTTGTFSPTGSMGTERRDHTATLLNNGKVLIVGGAAPITPQSIVPDAELYDPATGTFSPTGNMTSARWQHAATLLSDGKVLISGGIDSVGYVATGELFDPATQSFTATTGVMGAARSYHTATLLPDGTVLIAGGISSTGELFSLTAETFNPNSGTFSPTGGMATERYFHTATLLQNGAVLVTGGQAGGYVLSSAELYK
jgi:hypothetical protein